MKVLAIETTGEEKSIALTCEGVLQAEVSFRADLLTEFWKVMADFLKKNRLKIKEIDIFAVSQGPGSWTGLRFGLAVAKGWAAATGKKVFAMPAAEIQRVAKGTVPMGKGDCPHSLAAALACCTAGGADPEEIEPLYGHLPKFRKIREE